MEEFTVCLFVFLSYTQTQENHRCSSFPDVHRNNYFLEKKIVCIQKGICNIPQKHAMCVYVVTLTHKLPLLLCVDLRVFPTVGNSLQKHDNLSMQISEPQTTTHKHERTHLWIENLRRRKTRTLCSCITNAYVNLLSVHVECFYIYKSPHS